MKTTKSSRVRSISNGRLAHFLKRLLGEQKGAVAMEYIIIVLLVGIALFALFLTFSDTLQNMLKHVIKVLTNNKVEEVQQEGQNYNQGQEKIEGELKTAEDAADSFNGANESPALSKPSPEAFRRGGVHLMSHYLYTICIIAPLLALLCWHDCRHRLLPNLLTATLALVCLAWRFWQQGGRGALDGLLGGLVCALFLLVPFLLRGAGGGDVKMLFGAGIATGLRYCFAELLFVSLTGLALGLAMLAFGAVKSARLKHFFRSLFDWKYDRKDGAKALPHREDESGRIPFGVAIALGTVIALFYAYWMERPL